MPPARVGTATAPVRVGSGSLATRIALLSVGIVVLTAIVGGALATGLIRNAGASAAHSNLSKLADLYAGTVDGSTDRAGRTPRHVAVQRALGALGVRTGRITTTGSVFPQATGAQGTSTALVQRAITKADIAAVLAGHDVHASTSVGGTSVLVECRPTGHGGIALVQRYRDAVAQQDSAIRRLLLALLIAAILAAVIAALVAWRLARPLRRTAAAAHSMALGNRDVDLPVRGPVEVAEVSDAVNTLAAGLRHSEARQRQFLLSVSHDLRTPLTAITGFAESLADGVVPAEDTAYVGRVLQGEARRLERLVGDLLDLARLDAQDFRVDLATVDLVAVVHDAARVWTDRCTAAGVRFVLEAQPAPVWANTDANRIRQVLDGLFDNALRVTPAGSPIVLAVRSEAPPAAAPHLSAVVEVRDGGPGLSDDDLRVAFDQGALYERYRGVRQVGTGLGLAIVARLVSRLHGSIEAGHAREAGARFTVRLPRA